MCALVAGGGLVSSAKSALSEPTKRVTYKGYRIEVPGSWRVVDLARDPNVCARGTDQRLYETYFRPTTGWSAWHVKGGIAVAIA